MKAARVIVTMSGAQWQIELRNALESEGYEVTVAKTADQTVQETIAGLHDLLILDATVEDAMDGIEPHELCRAIRSKSDLGIIILSRGDGKPCSIDALNAGADDYLQAPFVQEELLARVRAILRRVARPA